MGLLKIYFNSLCFYFFSHPVSFSIVLIFKQTKTITRCWEFYRFSIDNKDVIFCLQPFSLETALRQTFLVSATQSSLAFSFSILSDDALPARHTQGLAALSLPHFKIKRRLFFEKGWLGLVRPLGKQVVANFTDYTADMV